MNKKLLIICGPTGSGKTDLSLECAKILDTEIICADSMTIYNGFDVGTAKITKEEMQGIKHHMLSIANPNQSFTVSDYKQMALPIINDLLSRNKTPIICGGTGFYINSILYDSSYGKSAPNLEVRDKYMSIAKERGNKFVYDILLELDYESAIKLHYNDLKRVVRALEIYHSGIKKSDIKDDFTPLFDYECYSYDYSREILYDRINKRVDLMIENGLVKEVKSLLDSGISETSQSMQGIGYKEIVSYLNDEINLNDAIELIKLNTRHYAKRQITFFKKVPNINYISPKNNAKDIAKIITKDLL